MPRVIESVSRVSGFEDALKVTNVKIETNEGEIIIKLENYLLSKDHMLLQVMRASAPWL